MLLAFNCLLLLFFLPGVPAPENLTKVKVTQVLTNDEICAILKPHEIVDEKKTEGYWEKQYPGVGNLALPVTRLALKEVKDSCGEVVSGWIISLAGHCGPLLHQFLVLTQEDIKSARKPGLLVVVFNPKNNITHADHNVCIEILKQLKELGVEIFKFTNPNGQAEEDELKRFTFFKASLSGDEVIKKMNGVNFLAISLCGASAGNDEKKFKETKVVDKKASNRTYCTDTLRAALSILDKLSPKLLPAGNQSSVPDASLTNVNTPPKAVLTLCSGNGRADDGTWAFKNEHRITHQPTQYWPMRELVTDMGSETRSFILKSAFLDLVAPQYDGKIEKEMLEKAVEAKKKIQKDIDQLKLNGDFDTDGYVEVEFEATIATSRQDDDAKEFKATTITV